MSNLSKRMDFSKFPRRVLPKHETLFFEEEASRDLYVLLSGTLGVYRDEIQVATIDEPLSVIGEMSALTGAARNATVRALSPSNLVVVSDPDLLFEEYPQMGSKLARVLASRLSRMNQRFVELKGVVARGGRSGPEPEPEEEVERTLELNLKKLVPQAGGAEPAVRAAGELSEDLLGELSDLLDLDPSLVSGT